MNSVPIRFQSTSKVDWCIQFASPQTELWTQSVNATNAYSMRIEFGSSAQCEKAINPGLLHWEGTSCPLLRRSHCYVSTRINLNLRWHDQYTNTCMDMQLVKCIKMLTNNALSQYAATFMVSRLHCITNVVHHIKLKPAVLINPPTLESSRHNLLKGQESTRINGIPWCYVLSDPVNPLIGWTLWWLSKRRTDISASALTHMTSTEPVNVSTIPNENNLRNSGQNAFC